jgi:hypothetical protein
MSLWRQKYETLAALSYNFVLGNYIFSLPPFRYEKDYDFFRLEAANSLVIRLGSDKVPESANRAHQP